MATLSSKTTPARRQRGSVACRRCRRLRIKCIHDANNTPPCEACRMLGSYDSQSCTFPRRGDADVDRRWRSRVHPHSQDAQEFHGGGKQVGKDPTPAAASLDTDRQVNHVDVSEAPNRYGSPGVYDEFPSAEEIIEACRVFTNSYFQLGFIPKTSFFERILRDEVSEFLLVCILCLSARFTPCLLERYGSASKATERFMAAALERVPFAMYSTSLENIQALFLLSIAEWGNGNRDRSSIHMGIAVRMAAMMKLHREESYQLPEDATNDQIIHAETARRTFWMIQSQDNLHSGYSSPLPFSCDDITALLPCGESDYSFGVIPVERAALPSTPPALLVPSLVDSPGRSLFATLIQSHSLWGQVARRACRPEKADDRPSNEYTTMASTLKQFEQQLPAQQKWSIWSLKVWKDLGFELAYLSVTMMIRLSNILMRRMYLENIKASISCIDDAGSPIGLWKSVAEELFDNVVELYQQIEASFQIRSQNEGYPAILVFPVYVCGSLALNLWQCPQLSQKHAEKATSILMRCLQIIENLQHAWPMAKKWQEGLQQAATPLSSGTSPVSVRGVPLTPRVREQSVEPKAMGKTVSRNHRAKEPDLNQGEVALIADKHVVAHPQRNDDGGSHGLNIDALPADLFDAEVTAFLQGDMRYGLLDEWNHAGFGFH